MSSGILRCPHFRDSRLPAHCIALSPGSPPCVLRVMTFEPSMYSYGVQKSSLIIIAHAHGGWPGDEATHCMHDHNICVYQ